MIKTSNEIFSTAGFPDVLDTNKDSTEFGGKVGKAIENEWFKRNKNSDARFYDNQFKYHRLRLYARAEQPIQKYKNEMAINGDLSYLNLDWTPVPILPKFIDIVVNGISNRSFSVKAQAVDSLATEQRSKYVIEMEKDMVARQMLMEGQEVLGVNGFANDPNSVPETTEELNVHMQLNYKQAIEIAEEEAIDYIFKANEFNDIKKRFDYDVAVLGVGAMKHTYDPSFKSGIKIEYVDPATLVHSYSEDPYRQDCYYFGEVKKIPLTELRKINPEITKNEMEQAKGAAADWEVYHRFKEDQRSGFDGHETNVLFFNYKTTKDIVYKKRVNPNTGKVSLIEKTEDWNPPADKLGDSKRIVKTIDVWYEGALVLGSNILLKWELVKNMVRPKSNNSTAMANYVVVAPRIYDDRTESLCQRGSIFADQIQIVSMKLQQVAARVVPDGVYIDADGLNEIDLGDGSKYDPKRALQLFFQTGSVIGRSLTSMGEFNHGAVPIKEINNNSGRAKIQALIELYNYYLQMLRDVTGLNEASDGSTPDSRSLVGVQKLAALNSNTATRHILDAGVYMTKKIAEAVGYRISDVLEYSDDKKTFIQAIGKANVSILQEISKLYLHDFGVFIEISPDAQEKEYLEQNIQQALAKELIYLDDAAELRDIKNVKLANQLMKIRRQAKLKEEQERQKDLIKTQSEEQTKTAQAKAQADQAKEQAKVQAQIAIDTNLKDLENRNQDEEMNRKEYLMSVEFEYNMQIRGMEASTKTTVENQKEDRKDKRQREQNTATSKIADQKAKGKAPVNFESTEDSLDGFDMSSFEPK
jgi:hypothetical protein